MPKSRHFRAKSRKKAMSLMISKMPPPFERRACRNLKRHGRLARTSKSDEAVAPQGSRSAK
eukprot:12077982-Alexandrium_andersonii.AAC.1